MDRLKIALANIDREIADETRSANDQVRLIAGLPPGSRERDAAVGLLSDLNRSIEVWQGERGRLLEQISRSSRPAPAGIEIQDAVLQRLHSDARRWHMKAEELRTVASGMTTRSAIQALEQLAANYELLATQAEAKAARVRAPKKGTAG